LLGGAGEVAGLGDRQHVPHLLQLHGSIVIQDRCIEKYVLDSLMVAG
jgi:hypothetical protein